MLITDAFNDVKDVPLRTPQAGEDSNSFGQFGALQVGGLGAKAFRTDDQGMWLGAQKFEDAPFSVDMEGAIIATSGVIAGWDINDTTIFKNNATLDSAGQLTLGTANDIAILSSVNATYRLWIGNATAGSAAFTVTKAGVMTATGGNFSGAITASTISIGTKFSVDINGVMTATGANFAGAITASTISIGANFSVDISGNLICANATVTGALTTAAGSSLSANYLSAGTMSVGGAGQVDAILIKTDDTHGDKNLRWEGLSRIWEDASNNLGIRATASVYLYAGNYSQEASFHSGSQSVFYHGVDCRGNLNIKTGVLRIEGLSSDPGGVGNGSIYYNTTSNTLRALNGGTWYTIQVA